MPSGVRGDGLGRALRRRITLLYADCSGCRAPSRMTVLRRESPLSRIANSERLPCRIASTRVLRIVPASIRRLFLLKTGCSHSARESAAHFNRLLERTPEESHQLTRDGD